MALSPLANNQLATDSRSLDNLKLQAGQKDPAAIQEAAKQFESLFMREMLKSMREATMKSGMLDSAQENMGTDMLDQQFSVQMSGKPKDLSDLIAKQLSRQMGVPETPAFEPPSTLSLGTASARCCPARARPPPRPPPTPRSRPPPARPPSCNACRAPPPRWSSKAAFRPATCWARRVTRPAGASTRSRTPTAAPRTTCSASRPGRAGRARWPP